MIACCRLGAVTALRTLVVGLFLAASVPSSAMGDDCDRNGVDDAIDISRTLFAPRVLSRHAAGITPRAVVVADLDGDGDPDLAVANRHSNTISRFDNQGGARFVELAPVESPNPAWLASGDFDHDGFVDLATMSSLATRGSLILNVGGALDTVVPFELGGAGHSFILSASLDGDEWLDVVTIDRFANRVVVFFGAAGGAFASGVSFAAPALVSIAAIALVDADGDGRTDIAMVGAHATDAAAVGGLHVLRGDGARAFAARGAPQALDFVPASLAVAELDGSPGVDFVVAGAESGGTARVDALFGQSGDIAFERLALRTGGTPVSWLAAGDLDLDGDDEVLVASDDSRLVVLTNDGGRSFRSTPERYVESLGNVVRDGALADLDGDGALEIAAAAYTSDNSHNEVVVIDLDRVAEHLDRDRDGQPDVCDPSCNDPGAPDCDFDGIPDACELAFGDEADCDGDGVMDRCETGGDPCADDLFAFALEGPSEFVVLDVDATVDGEFVVTMTPLGEVRESRFGGAQGWTLGVAAAGCTIVRATVAGTAGAEARLGPPGLMVSGFELTELASDGDVRGMISAVVLSAVQPITLPVDRPSPICRLFVEAMLPAGRAEGVARLTFRDRLRGTGQPVTNEVNWQSRPVRPLPIDRSFRLLSGVRDHRRGDANGDGRVDISDSVAVLSYLFLGATTPGCLDAADVDDSGDLDITDGASINIFLFLGGTAPPEPGPFACGGDPTPDALGCRRYTECE